MSARPHFVSVSGGIAVGKTTLTSRLAASLPSCQAIIEHPGRNPYLADFYDDMPKWAFHSRVAMLAMFASHYKHFDNSRQILLLDRCLHELIAFANLHVDSGNMNPRDFSIYEMLYESFLTLAPPLDVVVYLACSPAVATKRVAERDRVFERGISETYITTIERYYEQWIATLPPTTKVLKYNTDNGVDQLSAEEDIRRCLSI